MNYEIETDSKRKEPIFNKEHANIQIRMAATNLTNDILIPIIEDKIENQDSAIVFVQKKENRNSADMYIESGIYKIFVYGAFGIGYHGAGSSGVTKVLMSLGVDYDTADQLVTNSELRNGYIQVVFKN
ncbi:hypothetical protein ABE888_13410 [Enterococcus faecalis]|uniref:hypothetical protein n=1 Tax=Enterococcus faecalis TaxID=1351 RepID=UPI003D6A983C